MALKGQARKDGKGGWGVPESCWLLCHLDGGAWGLEGIDPWKEFEARRWP